jgi:hypothetical protein
MSTPKKAPRVLSLPAKAYLVLYNVIQFLGYVFMNADVTSYIVLGLKLLFFYKMVFHPVQNGRPFHQQGSQSDRFVGTG